MTMKRILITATIISMLSAVLPVAYAQDAAEAKLSGIYQTYNDIKVVHNVENAESIEWYKASKENGTYTKISDAESESYRVKSNDSGKWIKAKVISQETEAETTPKQIETRLTTRVSEGKIAGNPAETPQKYIFSVGGMDFILLDTTESDTGKFLVMTKESVGEREFCKKSSDDSIAQDFKDMGSFLNNSSELEYYYNHLDTASKADSDYSESGYKGNSKYTQLPQEVFDAIDNNIAWKTEPLKNGQARERAYRAGIALPSAEEIKKYAERIGWDGIENGFWLRTPCGSNSENVLYTNPEKRGEVKSENVNTGKHGLRLIFYVDRDFFIDNKPESAGSVVYEEMFKEYSKPELLKLYTQEELTTLGYIDFEIKDFSIIGDESEKQAKVEIFSQYGAEKEVTVLVAAYDSEGCLCGVNIDTILCVDGINTKEISLGNSDYSEAMAVIIDSVSNPAPIYRAARIGD